MDDGIGIELTGARELHDALGELTKATERTLLRRIATKALEPIVARAKELAPVDSGELRDSITIGTKLSKRARRAARADKADGVTVYAGSADRNAVPREFGTIRSRAEPFMRPAWDEGKHGALDYVRRNLGSEIEKTAARVARRALKLGK